MLTTSSWDSSIVNGQSEEADLDTTVAQRLDLRRGQQCVELDLDVRKAGRPDAQDTRQDVQVGRRHEADRQLTDLAAAGALRRTHGALGLREHPAHLHSPRLVELLTAEYPDSVHVRSIGLRGAPDRVIWEYAKDNGFSLVSKDNDFRQLSFLYGAPPKVIWLSVGNAGTVEIAGVLRGRREEVSHYGGDAETSLLVITLASEAPER